MVDSPLQAAAKFRRAGARISAASKKGERNAAQFVKATILAGSPGRLRNVGKNGTRLGVNYKADPSGGTLVQASGPWQLIERDTKAHTIIGKGVGRVKRGSTKGLSKDARSAVRYGAKQNLYNALFGGPGGGGGKFLIDGNWYTGPIHHPGTQGKHPFARGVETARPGVPRLVDAEVKLVLLETFGL